MSRVSAHASIRNGCAWRSSILKVGRQCAGSFTDHDFAAVECTTCCARNTNNLPESWAAVTKRRRAHPRKRSSLFILRAWCSPILLNVQVQRYCIVVPENRSTSGVHALPSLSSRTCRSIYPVPCLSSPGPTRPVFALSLFTLIALLCQPNNSNAPLTASAPLLVRLKASST
jgi:hypothetical protein